MPKQKTRKAAAKRFRKTATGKFKHSRAGKRHILTKKTAKRKNRLGTSKVLAKTEMKRVKTSLPYA